MSAQGLRPKQKGDKLLASEVNAIVGNTIQNSRRLNEVLAQAKVGKFLSFGSTKIKVHNTESTVRTAYKVMGIKEPTFKANENELTQNVWDIEDTIQAEHFNRFVVLAEDVPPGAIGNAWSAGFIITQVKIKDLTHKHAQLAADDDEYLTTSYTGSAVVLWREAGSVDDTVWCVIMFPVDFFQDLDPMPAITTTAVGANGLVMYDGWDATAGLIKVKQPDEDSPEVTARVLSSEATASGDTCLITPQFGKILYGTYDTAPDELLDDYGAGDSVNNYKKDETGYKIVADLGGGGFFVPFKPSLQILYSWKDARTIDTNDFYEDTNDPSASGGDTYDRDAYINFATPIPISMLTGYVTSNTNLSTNLRDTADDYVTLKNKFKIDFFEDELDLSTITTWAGRPTGSGLMTLAIAPNAFGYGASSARVYTDASPVIWLVNTAPAFDKISAMRVYGNVPAGQNGSLGTRALYFLEAL